MGVTINQNKYQIALASDFSGVGSRGFIIEVNAQSISGFIVFDWGVVILLMKTNARIQERH